MSIFKRIFQGEHGRFVTYCVVVVLVFFLILLFGTGSNLLNWFSVKREISSQEKQIEKYREEIEEMNRQIELIQTDKDALEEFARESFHFSAPDEDVYVFDE